MMPFTPHNFPKQQRGAATLLISLALLISITLISVYTARTTIMEQKIAANDFRTKQAFEAADAGMEYAIAYIRGPGGVDKDANGALDTNIVDSNSDGTYNTNTLTLSTGATYTIALSGSTGSVIVTSTGTSDDGTATRTITQTIGSVDPLPNEPHTPLTTRGGAFIGGSATVINPEGKATIWSGGNVDLGSNNSTATMVADPTDATYPACIGSPEAPCDVERSSDKDNEGFDLVENDANLSALSSDDYFLNFFGLDKTTYRNTRVEIESTGATATNNHDAASPGINLAQETVVWVDGGGPGNNVSIGGVTVGCASSVNVNANYEDSACDNNNGDPPFDAALPTITIIDGDASATGSTTLLGLVYITGDFNITGNVTVVGAVIVEGQTLSSGGGSLDIIYNSRVLGNAGGEGNSASLAGSWRDF
ncbi:hypothetical protein BOW53_04260 [Solemya pervernicosa gill symbiont]|uniref:Type 4 fimbrial biogenesis protein PilX N-terminal domain-containing protein n=2 Tax=Gammaproteobacteria incertae sedis TaxID=118884 RepID=A0A1T2L8S2_9GAMM|nr:PilX N-terminal domain-containing pilus assembly protein [Candidatus Reidiella endopervernicosa]OOZ41336.1 hypothetical protein BOW53_04260 [Solemya pervernicosa gill symbiont]QKQ27712.1 pilus assembly PilX N-terminal domain-containing protein [Candidatus Reidiella endopervernicosa]